MELIQIRPKAEPTLALSGDAVGVAQDLCERFRRSSKAVSLVESMLPDMREIAELSVERLPMEQKLNVLTHLVGKELEVAIKQAETALRDFERSFEKLDRKIPMAWFRKYCVITEENAEGFANYVGLLARYLSSADDALRLDRIQLVITRLVEKMVPYEHHTIEARRALVMATLPESGLAEDVIIPAVAFFKAALNRLQTYDHLDELLGSEFFFETRGYKLALRSKVLEPKILTMVIELNEAVEATIERLAKADLAPGQDLKAAMAAADARVRELFSKMRVDESGTEKGFEAIKARRDAWKEKKEEEQAALARKERRKAEKERWNPKKVNWLPFQLLVMAALGALLFVRWPKPNMRTLDDIELRAVSPVLQSAAVGPLKHPTLLQGQVDGAKWQGMTPALKKDVANELAAHLSTVGVQDATINMGEFIAITIRGGEVLIVR